MKKVINYISAAIFFFLPFIRIEYLGQEFHMFYDCMVPTVICLLAFIDFKFDQAVETTETEDIEEDKE